MAKNSGRHTETVSASAEEYLEWIYRLSKEQEKVSASDLSRSLQVSPASVTHAMKRLVERELVVYRPYHGITLTDQGRSLAARIIRRHGLLERLLCDVVGVPWHHVDDAVRHLQHYVTEEVEERLARFLNYPRTCPHGQPIDWETAGPAVRLSDLQPGASGVVSRIGDETPEFLEYVQSIGLLPAVRVSVVRREPFGGPMVVQVGEAERVVGDGVLKNIWIEETPVGVST